ncbi:GntR family transcriptional regulator [Oleispirillum naphthae]|uniref:GntR family transcriptional regulator n=1 Tax=Oleispirillum naphthae TaxID=2838853 RepID=UPI0030822EF2
MNISMKETLYAQVARDLSEGIASGRFPVGSHLPTEMELCAQYGASRHTIRTAMRELQGLGLISRRKKAGTRVESTPTASLYRSSISSVEDLSQFGVDHKRVIREVADIIADRTFAKTFGRPAGTRWVRFSAVRVTGPDDETPIVWTDIYAEETYSAVREMVREHPELLIATMIERHYGRRIAEVRQTIAPTLVSEAMAAALGVPPASLALRIVRHYVDMAGEAFVVSESILPADRFTFTMRLTRQPNTPA